MPLREPVLLNTDLEDILEIGNSDLVEMCLTGDKEALNLFYTRFAPRMMGVIRRYVPNMDDAQDILHDGFIVAYTRMRDLRDAGLVEYWLASIMRNLALQFLREQDIAVILHEIPEVEETQELEDLMDIDMLEKLIRKLPVGYQKVFRLSVLENMSHKEIAKILGIAPSTSASQLFHAKIMMRRLIREYKGAGVLVLLLLLGVGVATMFFHNPDSEEKFRARTDKVPEAVRQEPLPLLSDNVPVDSVSPAGSSQSSPAFIAALPADTVKLACNEPAVPDSAAVESNDRPVVVLEKTYDYVTDNSMIAADSVLNIEQDNSVSQAALDLDYKGEKASGWSLGVGSDFVIGTSWVGAVAQDAAAGITGPGAEPDPGDKIDPDSPDNPGDPGMRKSPNAPVKDYSDVSHQNYMPVTVAVTAAYRFNRIFSLESGVRYSYLHSRYEYDDVRSHCHWHYIGIPLKLNINTFTHGRMSLYGSVGATVNFPVYSQGVIGPGQSYYDRLPSGSLDAKVMWSISASYGISLRLSNNVSIFLEPTLQYMPKVRTRVPNYWTEEPWNFALPLGFRFTW